MDLNKAFTIWLPLCLPPPPQLPPRALLAQGAAHSRSTPPSPTRAALHCRSDNWSQVRFAASTATRTFMGCAAPYRERVFPLLLPHMCLNR